MAKTKFKTFFLIGFILLVISLTIWLIPSVYLVAINQRIEGLNSQPKGLEFYTERIIPTYQNMKVLWETKQATIYNPISIALLAISAITIVCGVKRMQTMNKNQDYSSKLQVQF